ncbi:MAG: hypothetical protein AAFX94_23295 [Myxococcota bacterium]
MTYSPFSTGTDSFSLSGTLTITPNPVTLPSARVESPSALAKAQGIDIDAIRPFATRLANAGRLWLEEDGQYRRALGPEALLALLRGQRVMIPSAVRIGNSVETEKSTRSSSTYAFLGSRGLNQRTDFDTEHFSVKSTRPISFAPGFIEHPEQLKGLGHGLGVPEAAYLPVNTGQVELLTGFTESFSAQERGSWGIFTDQHTKTDTERSRTDSF